MSGIISDCDGNNAPHYYDNKQRNFFSLVYDAVQKIPCGKVATYGQIARLCGSPRSARAVGYALHVNPLPGIVPCHRVVGSNGSLTGYAGGINKKIELLKLEGAFREGFFVPKKSTAP